MTENIEKREKQSVQMKMRRPETQYIVSNHAREKTITQKRKKKRVENKNTKGH